MADNDHQNSPEDVSAMEAKYKEGRDAQARGDGTFLGLTGLTARHHNEETKKLGEQLTSLGSHAVADYDAAQQQAAADKAKYENGRLLSTADLNNQIGQNYLKLGQNNLAAEHLEIAEAARQQLENHNVKTVEKDGHIVAVDATKPAEPETPKVADTRKPAAPETSAVAANDITHSSSSGDKDRSSQSAPVSLSSVQEIIEQKHGLLAVGSKEHEAVLALQHALNENAKNEGKHLITEDGKIGDQTKERLVEFQKDHHLDGDGIAGPKTFAQLKQVFGDQPKTEIAHSNTPVDRDHGDGPPSTPRVPKNLSARGGNARV